MLTRALAVELRAARHPGQRNRAGILQDRDERAARRRSEFSAWVARRTPAGRWGEPAEIAGAAVFLASRGRRLRHGPRALRRRRLFGVVLSGSAAGRRGCTGSASAGIIASLKAGTAAGVAGVPASHVRTPANATRCSARGPARFRHARFDCRRPCPPVAASRRQRPPCWRSPTAASSRPRDRRRGPLPSAKSCSTRR
mgnify:CR=1 FL=1